MGLGIRQFCDWAMVLNRHGYAIDKNLLQKHLQGVGLLKAYIGFGAVLTDYLGLPEEIFPFEISCQDHKGAKKIVSNLLKMGNFGHNIEYQSAKGPKHAIEHSIRMASQGRLFFHYAPKEVLWRLPYFIGWWGKRIYRGVMPNNYYSKSVFQS